MNVYRYRAVPMALLERPKGIIGAAWDRVLRFFRLRRGHVITSKWVESMEENVEEGTIDAVSWEDATLKLISKNRLYPIELDISLKNRKNEKFHNLNDIKDFLLDQATR